MKNRNRKPKELNKNYDFDDVVDDRHDRYSLVHSFIHTIFPFIRPFFLFTICFPSLSSSLRSPFRARFPHTPSFLPRDPTSVSVNFRFRLISRLLYDPRQIYGGIGIGVGVVAALSVVALSNVSRFLNRSYSSDAALRLLPSLSPHPWENVMLTWN